MVFTQAHLNQLLRSFPGIEPGIVDVLLSVSHTVTYKKCQTIYHQGEPCCSGLFLVEGRLIAHHTSADGHEFTIGHAKSGQSVSLVNSCLLAGHQHSARIIAESNVLALEYLKDDFVQAICRSEVFRKYIFGSVDNGINGLLLAIQNIAYGHMDQRLAQLLINMADDGAMVSATHYELATELGTAREVVSRLLKDFEHKGYLQLHRGSISIQDREKLIHKSLH